MSTIRKRVSNTKIRKYFSFFEFYYYVLKRSPKRYNISNSNETMHYFSILMTPFVLWIISMVIFLVAGHGWATVLFTGLGAILILNFIFTRSVLDEAYKIQRELNEERREMEKEERRRKLEAERKCKEKLRKERVRQAFESFREEEREKARRRATQQPNNAENIQLQLFAVLGIKPTTDLKVIKNAYRQKAKKHHPDKGGDELVFIQVKKAYDAILKLVDSKN